MEGKCRLCLSKEKLIWIFDQRIINTNKLSDIIYNATGVLISETDPVTQMVCHECCLYTVEIYKFRIKCLINNNLLHNLIADCKQIKTEIKQEPESNPNKPINTLGTLSQNVKLNSSPRKRQHCNSIEASRLDNVTDERQACLMNTEQIKDKENDNSNKDNVKHENYENDSVISHISNTSSRNELTQPVSNRLMLTRAKRKLKSHIEKQKLDKQKVIESLYAENIDKIMFTSYLKLAPKYEASALGNSAYKEGLINCKLCKASIDSGNTLREHLENECSVFKMIDNLPSVDIVRVENVKSVRERYPGVVRNVRAVKKPKRFRCSCCDDGSD